MEKNTKAWRALALCIAATSSFFIGAPAQATPEGYQYFLLGTGTGMIVHLQPCADIPCNQGDTCSCINVQGNLKVRIEDGKHYIPGSYTLEISADDSTNINNGANGSCFGSTGKLSVTVPQGSLFLPFSGLGCRIPFNSDVRTFGISAPVVIASGTGAYTTPQGTGAFSGSFQPTTGNVTFDLTGYALFHR